MTDMQLKANLGLLLRGDYTDMVIFMQRLQEVLKGTGVVLVHKHVSASRLWIKEGDMDDGFDGKS